MSDFRIDPNLSIGAVHLTVRSVDRSLALYRDILGLTPQPANGGSVALAVDDEPPLVVLTEDPDAPRRPQRSPGLYHMAILVPSRADLARILVRFSEARYAVQGASDHGVSEALYLADPEGNGIEIYRDRPRAEWPVKGDALQMITEALDIDSVMESAGAELSAQGLPPGTRMGHVHLQVSQIPPSEAFYLDVLGLDLMQRYGPSASFMSAGGYHHHVGMNTWVSAGAPPAPPGATGLRHITLRLPSAVALADLEAHLDALGAPFERCAAGTCVDDPSGNRILVTA